MIRKLTVTALLCVSTAAVALTPVDSQTFHQAMGKVQQDIQSVQNNIPKQLEKQQKSTDAMKVRLEGEIKASQKQVMQQVKALQATLDQRVTQLQTEISGIQAQIMTLRKSVTDQVAVLKAAIEKK